MSVYQNKPQSFFELVVHDLKRSPGLTGAFAGYESGEWRFEQMAEYLFEWLPEFALKYSDLEDINSGTARQSLRKAAKIVYNTEKYSRRGEFGELLLHALIREVFNSQPAISKLYYKSAINDPVKGFDAVHVVENGDELELWLGEVKFYKEVNAAIREIVIEINAHLNADYLRDEFILIATKIDPKWKHSEKLRRLISERTSLDTVFKRVCIPVLLTYESPTIIKNNEISDVFYNALKKEVEVIHENFSKAGIPEIKIHLFLAPLGEKKKLIDALHEKLEGMQR